MRYEEMIESLESEWSPDDGCFWDVRQGLFSPDAFDRALGKVRAIVLERDAVVPRRVVSLLWFIPLFMQWQTDRVRECKGDVTAYETATSLMTDEIMRILGVP